MNYAERIEAHAAARCSKVVDHSLYLSGYRDLSWEDDGNPEGGIIASVTFEYSTDFYDPEQALAGIKRLVPIWAFMKDRPYAFEHVGEGIEARFYLPIPNVPVAEYGELALKVWKADGLAGPGSDYKDDTIRIFYNGHYLETQRQSNRNPTTMIKFDGTTLGECIRHHGEHIYILKHLLKLAESL